MRLLAALAALDAPETPDLNRVYEIADEDVTHVDRHGRSWDRHPFVQGRFTGNGVCMCGQQPEHEIHTPETNPREDTL